MRKTPEVRLPVKATSRCNNNSAPARMPTSSPTSRSNLPETHPHILPDEPRTAEMQELHETMPGQQWVRTDEVNLLQQLLDATRERKAGEEGMFKQEITMKTKREKGRKRRQRRQGAGKAVVIKTEYVDGNSDTRHDSAYGSATEFVSGLHSRSPPLRAWAAPKAASIINIVALCTYPGQTIKPSSVKRLFTLQQRIDAAINDKGSLRNILRNLPRDITLTVERKEAIWVAQGKLNRVVDERRRGSRRQKLDRYVPANRWVPIDRYIPGVPYDPNPHMLAMRLFARTVA